jgi:putative transposase
LISEGPAAKPSQWTRLVNAGQTEAELQLLRKSVSRGTPFGETSWQLATAKTLGLESSLRPIGRPKLEK